MNIRELFKELQEITGFKQVDIAADLNVTCACIGVMLGRDAHKDGTGYGMGMKIDTLVRICHAFGYDVVVQPAGMIQPGQKVIGSPALPKKTSANEPNEKIAKPPKESTVEDVRGLPDD
ncbi:hypothetical protein [Gemmiger sp.]